jgi:hypothetical protein
MPVLVEHTFVTTLDKDETFRAAELFLEDLGFVRQDTEGEGGLAFRGGKSHPGYARTLRDHPRRLHIEFDRGRVSVAASIQLEGNRRKPLATDLLFAVANRLEKVLTQQRCATEARAEWDHVCEQIAARAGRRRRLTIGCAVAFVLGVGVLVLLALQAGK